ncbi:vitamin B12-dependent ribonucleotide reductase [Candidatus Woesearchaeota archaeon]|jgi:ribonucleoside-diphosphate reductase alpha chain|nr:vitamin B12-dependent ribonucleotide reductase [Candidatus Woesearchaeota archaeon]MBT4835031.1 vitamin B12-dependent ribonucleotide reductase [Candidatus Woesearchaeota archaeon]MBT7169684.1 vitamin B12-dependent ribonucleotide reductase [Candidatus Woesearchaeota archaeon]
MTKKITNNPVYDPEASRLNTYDPERHISIDDAKSLIHSESFTNSYLDGGVEKLESALESGSIIPYDRKDGSYVDRLAIGRLFHQKNEKIEGISMQRYNTDEHLNPLDSIGPYETRHLQTLNSDGKILFDMVDAEVPVDWSENDAKIVMSKYAYVPRGTNETKKLESIIGNDHENSIKHIWTRVANYVAESGEEHGYFPTLNDTKIFRDELLWLMANRKLAFNSPVQFNAGLNTEYGIKGNGNIKYWRDPDTGEVIDITEGGNIAPQNHACFIIGPRDDLTSIAKHAVDEIGIFESGSGVGQDIGILRAAGESLSCGGGSSGPLSFWKGYDVWAGTIKSGGKSRRAARMTTMRQAHPDVMEFIKSKVGEEKKILALMRAGYEGGMDGEAVTTVAYQNTNISVRLDDNFFDQIESGGTVELRNVRDGDVVQEISADEMLKEISFGVWRVGDPGVQFEDTIQNMHTVKNSGRINSSNPCSEYMSLDNTACNLASLNLLGFADDEGNFDVEGFQHAARISAIGQNILNQSSGYPVKSIAQISPELNNIGLGYANIGALLMRKGLAYDSQKGREYAAAITALLTGTAYETSADLAGKIGTFEHFEFNKNPMMEVIGQHKKSLESIVVDSVPSNILEAAKKSWENAEEMGEEQGFRNSQVSVLAPTGTISYLMGCETTGPEPYIAFSIGKDLAGGGSLKLEANKEIPKGLRNLGYPEEDITKIANHIAETGTTIGSPDLKPEHQKVFETAMGNQYGEGSIPFSGHVKMLGAMQPFISGAISKTNNFPESTTVKEIYDGLIESHAEGLKAVAAFRSNSKLSFALSFGNDRNLNQPKWGEKVDLPTKRQAYEWEFKVGETPVHLITSEYPDTGLPGQIALLAYDGGTTLNSSLKIAGIQASKSLKSGTPLEKILDSWKGHTMEPRGLVFDNDNIKQASSIFDAAQKILRLEYLGDASVAQEPEKVNFSKLRGSDSGSFRHLEREKVDEWKIEDVLKDSETGGFNNGKKTLKKAENSTRTSGATCHCGRIMRQTGPGCFECSCGDKVGGCGG